VAEKSTQPSEGRSRIERLRFSFSDLGIDALVVSNLPDILYLCGFSGSAGLLLVEHSRSTLFTDSRYTFQARAEVSEARVSIVKHGPLAAVGSALRAMRGRTRVGYAASHLTVEQKKLLEGYSGGRVRWVPDGNVVAKLRCVKDAGELSRMKGAALAISEVFGTTLPLIRPGVTELDLAAEIEYAMRQQGASGPAFETIVASGPRTAWAHARPTAKPFSKNELVLIDCGAILHAYCSDLTRTVFLGRPPKKVRKMYQAVLDAQEAAKQAIRPGVKAGDVDRAARVALKLYGMAAFFTHSLGHGLGLEVHEMPRLGRGVGTLLQEGMVITVEPGVYIEGLGGIRIEDDVVVTANGAVDLTTASREFFEL